MILLVVVAGAIVSAGGIGYALVVRRLDYRDLLLFLIAFLMPLRNASLLELPGANLRIGDVAIAAAAGILAIEFLLGRTIRLRAADRWLAVFVLWGFGTLIWSLDPAFGLARALKYARNYALLVVVACWAHGRLVRAWRAVTAGVVASFAYLLPALALSLANSGVSLASLSQSGGWSADLRFRDAASGLSFGAPINMIGLWSIVAVFMWLGTALWAARLPRWRALFWIGLIPIMATLLITFSRGAWAGLAVGGAWWLWRAGRRIPRRMAAMAAGGVLVAVSTLYASGLLSVIGRRAQTILTPAAETSIQLRFTYWNLTWQALRERPLGLGLGATTVAIEPTTGEWFVHNLFLQMLAEVGPVGVVIAAAAFWCALSRALRVARDAPRWLVRVAALSLATALTAYLVDSVVGNDLTETEVWMVLGLVSALPATPAVTARGAPQRADVPRGTPAMAGTSLAS
jgi:hypothetical protein